MAITGTTDINSSSTVAIKDPNNGNTLVVNNDGSINVNGGGGGSSQVEIINGSNTANVTSNGSLQVVNVPSGTPISLYNEITGVAMGATQTILTYTVPGSTTLILTRVMVSGDSIGDIELNFNSTTNNRAQLYYTSFNVNLEYSNAQGGYSLPSGTVIDVIITNRSSQGTGIFRANLQGVTQ